MFHEVWGAGVLAVSSVLSGPGSACYGDKGRAALGDFLHGGASGCQLGATVPVPSWRAMLWLGVMGGPLAVGVTLYIWGSHCTCGCHPVCTGVTLYMYPHV